MPSPLELLLDPISLTLLARYASLIVWEAAAPARKLPPVKNWKMRGLASFVVYFLLYSYLPLLWTEHLARYQLVDLTALGTWTGALVGLLVYEAGAYVWHRTMHGSNLLWRMFHQCITALSGSTLSARSGLVRSTWSAGRRCSVCVSRWEWGSPPKRLRS